MNINLLESRKIPDKYNYSRFGRLFYEIQMLFQLQIHPLEMVFVENQVVACFAAEFNLALEVFWNSQTKTLIIDSPISLDLAEEQRKIMRCKRKQMQ